MTYDRLLENINRHIAPDKAEIDYFLSKLVYREAVKKELILHRGRECRDFSYVDSGALRAYFRTPQGREATIMFAVSDWWITDMYCFLNRLPAMMQIEAIEDSCLFQISRDDMDEILTHIPKFERFFRILMQNAYTREQLRSIQNLSLPAEERYRNFLAKYPQIVEKVTQRQIASYLGITPEFLSSIRRKTH